MQPGATGRESLCHGKGEMLETRTGGVAGGSLRAPASAPRQATERRRGLGCLSTALGPSSQQTSSQRPPSLLHLSSATCLGLRSQRAALASGRCSIRPALCQAVLPTVNSLDFHQEAQGVQGLVEAGEAERKAGGWSRLRQGNPRLQGSVPERSGLLTPTGHPVTPLTPSKGTLNIVLVGIRFSHATGSWKR